MSRLSPDPRDVVLNPRLVPILRAVSLNHIWTFFIVSWVPLRILLGLSVRFISWLVRFPISGPFTPSVVTEDLSRPSLVAGPFLWPSNAPPYPL